MLSFGRILQGVSAGIVGVVVPMYLAECLDAKKRGSGTALFQLILTFLKKIFCHFSATLRESPIYIYSGVSSRYFLNSARVLPKAFLPIVVHWPD